MIRIVGSETGPSPLDTTVASVDHHKLGVRVVLKQVPDRAAAERLAGALVYVRRDDMPPLRAGEYYDFEVVGCAVTTADGRHLGAVTEVLPTGASDVYVVRGEHGEILIPVVAGAILSLDVDSRQITVEPSALEYSKSTFEP